MTEVMPFQNELVQRFFHSALSLFELAKPSDAVELRLHDAGDAFCAGASYLFRNKMKSETFFICHKYLLQALSAWTFMSEYFTLRRFMAA
jgi:kynureninase